MASFVFKFVCRKDFVQKVDVITNEGEEIVKTRLIDADDSKKHVEINKFDTGSFGPLQVDAEKYDVVIVADLVMDSVISSM